MISIKVPNKKFCIAPWTHTYLSPQSERRLCCASREEATWQRQYIDAGDAAEDEYLPLTLDDHWNSDKMKSVRRRMLAGDDMPECQVCNESVLNIYTYKNYFNHTLFPEKIEKAISETDSDGKTSMRPISFDYRISNICTFKCRMCGELFSSAWEAEKRALGLWTPENDRWMLPENKRKIRDFQKNVAEQELWQAVKSQTIEEIYWVGGEPLNYLIHWEVMKFLVDSGHSKNVVVRYNTNLDNVRFKETNLYDLLPHFKRVNMCCSMDATGEIAEWIRTGLNWQRWLENFKSGIFLIEQYGMDAMVIDVTITLPGLLDMKNLILLAVQLKVKSYVKITFDFDPAVLLSPMSLPRDILDEILDDLIVFEEKFGNQYTKIYSETFRDMKTRKTFQEKYENWKEGAIEGKLRLQRIAEYRKDVDGLTLESIFKNHPEVLSWWKGIA